MLEKTDEVTRTRIFTKIEAHKQEREYIKRFPKSIGLCQIFFNSQSGTPSSAFSPTEKKQKRNSIQKNKRWSLPAALESLDNNTSLHHLGSEGSETNDFSDVTSDASDYGDFSEDDSEAPRSRTLGGKGFDNIDVEMTDEQTDTTTTPQHQQNNYPPSILQPSYGQQQQQQNAFQKESLLPSFNAVSQQAAAPFPSVQDRRRSLNPNVFRQLHYSQDSNPQNTVLSNLMSFGQQQQPMAPQPMQFPMQPQQQQAMSMPPQPPFAPTNNNPFFNSQQSNNKSTFFEELAMSAPNKPKRHFSLGELDRNLISDFNQKTYFQPITPAPFSGGPPAPIVNPMPTQPSQNMLPSISSMNLPSPFMTAQQQQQPAPKSLSAILKNTSTSPDIEYAKNPNQLHKQPIEYFKNMERFYPRPQPANPPLPTNPSGFGRHSISGLPSFENPQQWNDLRQQIMENSNTQQPSGFFQQQGPAPTTTTTTMPVPDASQSPTPKKMNIVEALFMKKVC